MPVKRKYHVKGTNDFIVLAGIFFFLCLWSIKDAWYPSEKVLTKHPLEIIVTAEAGGTVDKMMVDTGDAVAEDTVLAILRSDRISSEFEEAKKLYTEAKREHARLNASPSGDAAEITAAQERMDQALAKVEELRIALDSMEIKSPDKGEIKESYISSLDLVEAGDHVFLIDPQDHFYLFNKSLAIFSFLLFWVFLAIHLLGR